MDMKVKQYDQEWTDFYGVPITVARGAVLSLLSTSEYRSAVEIAQAIEAQPRAPIKADSMTSTLTILREMGIVECVHAKRDPGMIGRKLAYIRRLAVGPPQPRITKPFTRRKKHAPPVVAAPVVVDSSPALAVTARIREALTVALAQLDRVEAAIATAPQRALTKAELMAQLQAVMLEGAA